MFCPGQVDEWGCQMPDECLPKHFGLDGRECPSTCPTFCRSDEILCPSHPDENGCLAAPDTCLPRTTVGLDGEECPTICPVECPPGLMACGASCQETGCPLPKYCAETCN